MRKTLIVMVLVLAAACALAVLPACSGAARSDSSAASSANPASNDTSQAEIGHTTLRISVNDAFFEAELADTAAARELSDTLRGGPMAVRLHEYGGFEKVGPLPVALTAQDVQVETRPGDIMLYQGNQMAVFYGSNKWAYTPLAHIDATAGELAGAFGEADADVTLSVG